MAGGLAKADLGSHIIDKIASLETEIEITSQVEANLKTNNLDTLSELVSRAKGLNIDNSKVIIAYHKFTVYFHMSCSYLQIQEARIVCSRTNVIEDVKLKLKSAVESRNLSELCRALEDATTMALNESEMALAKKVRKELEGEADTIAILSGAINALSIKFENASGIQSSDLETVKSAMVTVKKAGLDNDVKKVYNHGVATLQKGEAQIKIQASLATALKNKDIPMLKKCLAEAQDLDIKVKIYALVVLRYIMSTYLHFILENTFAR